jgi:hypothetical protein
MRGSYYCPSSASPFLFLVLYLQFTLHFLSLIQVDCYVVDAKPDSCSFQTQQVVFGEVVLSSCVIPPCYPCSILGAQLT